MTLREKKLLETYVRETVQKMLNEEDPNYRKKADWKYSDRNKFLIDKTTEFFDSTYYKTLNDALDKIMDNLRGKLSAKDVVYGRTANSDIKVIRTTLKKKIIDHMNKYWTE